MTEASSTKDRSRAVRPSILLVDDDPGGLAVLEELLEDQYDLVSVTSGAEALGVLERRDFDLVITDQVMPGMTGVELLARARELRPDTVRMILSAYTDSNAMLRAINEGHVYRFLVKPWDDLELLTVVRQCLEHRQNLVAIKFLLRQLSEKNRQLEEYVHKLESTQDKLLHSAKLATIGQLTSGIIHEMKNQLIGVAMLEEVINGVELPEEARRYVNVGLEAVNVVLHMVEDLHSFAGTGSWSLQRTACDLNEVAEEAMRFVALDPLMKTCKRSFTPYHEPLWCFVDKDKVKQVLINLLRNAAQATAGRGRIELRVDLSGDRAVLHVKDDGPGIPKEKLEAIWQPFFSTKSTGLGLGLELSKGLVEAHGGTIGVISREGEGAEFTVFLPLEPPTTTDEP